MIKQSCSSLKRFATIACTLSALGMAAPAFADFNNPGFESGASGWTWKQYKSSAPSTNCTTAPLYSWQPTYFPAHNGGQAARLIASRNASLTVMEMCGETSQVINVPAGPSTLQFNYKLGETAFSTTTYYPVQLSVVVESLNGSAPTTVFIDSGTTVRTGTCSSCPAWEDASVDLSDFAGTTVRVRFVSQSRESNVSGLTKNPGHPQSAAFLDDIHLDEGTTGCTAPPSHSPNEGWFLDSAKPNTAVQVSPRGDSLILGWLTFEQGGTPVWYFGQPSLDSCGAFSGPIFKYRRNPFTGVVTETEAATVNLSFDASGSGSFSYDFDGESRTTTIGYFDFAPGYGSVGLTGFYADTTRANSGTYVVSQGDVHLVANYIFDSGGNPTWTFGQGQTTGSTVSGVPMNLYYGSGRCPLCTGPVGSVGVIGLGDIDLLPQNWGNFLINGQDGALSGNSIDWPFSYTPHAQL